MAKYDFDRLNIGDGVSVTLTGSNPLEINVSGDATILSLWMPTVLWVRAHQVSERVNWVEGLVVINGTVQVGVLVLAPSI